MFTPLPSVPDHPALEREVLELWERERTFERLREQNAGGPRWSFIDGPITANNPMGVHHAWGRALKDVFQRYHALRGFDERYQNGFDCQGLWVEVGVEKELGLNSKREIEEYGIAEFAERCKERVANYVGSSPSSPSASVSGWTGATTTSPSPTRTSSTSGASSRSATVGVALPGSPLDPVVPALRHLALAARAGRRGEPPRDEAPVALRPVPAAGTARAKRWSIWTTTPWTLPANVAAAVKPDAEYVLDAEGEWRARELAGDGRARQDRPRRGARRAGVRRALRRASGAGGRRPPRDPLGRGRARRGHRHRPHRSRARAPRTSSSRASTTCGCWRRSTRRGGSWPATGSSRPAHRRGRRADRRVAARGGPAGRGRDDRPPLPDLLALQDAARLPRRGRLVHRLRRDPAAAARRQPGGRVDAAAVLEAHGRLAAQHGGLEHLAQALLWAAAAAVPL